MPLIKRPSYMMKTGAKEEAVDDSPHPVIPDTDAEPKKEGGMMSFLGKVNKGLKYASALATRGTFGLQQEYMAQNPKEVIEGAASLAQNIIKTPIQLAKTGIGEVANITGNEELEKKAKEPTNVPFLGDVKSFSAKPGDVEKFGSQTAGEDLVQAGNMYLEAGAPGAGKALAKGWNAAKKVLPSLEKTGSVLANVSEDALKEASKPNVAKRIKAIRDLGITGEADDGVRIGEDLFSEANKERKATMDAYKTSRADIVAEKSPLITQRASEFRTNAVDTLKNNRIKVGEDGVETIGSQFEGDAGAKATLDKVYKLMSRPSQGTNVVEDLLTRREALTQALDGIPPNEKNLRRVIKEMQKGFDSTLDDVLGKEASELRSDYARRIKPTNAVIAAVTKQGEFSPDKANRFIQQAMQESKFDNRNLLTDLDAVANTNFAENVKAVGINKALSKLETPTGSRVFDVARTYVISKIPGASALVSPAFWGQMALRKGLKASEAAVQGKQKADAMLKLFLTNIMAYPLRSVSSPTLSEDQMQ